MRGAPSLARCVAAALVLTLVAGCDRRAEAPTRSRSVIAVPSTWQSVVITSDGGWTEEEAEVLNAALYLVESTLPGDDPRRQLLRSTPYVPFDRWADVDGTPPEGVEAVFSMRTERIYVHRPEPSDVLHLAATLAHELHHAERDLTESVNRMQEVDRERVAHARQAEDAGRMLIALWERGFEPASLAPLELAQAKARTLAAMYSVKFELFRLIQAMDRVEGLSEMPELFRLYLECLELAQADLATGQAREFRLLEALALAIDGTAIVDTLARPIDVAWQSLRECERLNARVEEIRSASGLR